MIDNNRFTSPSSRVIIVAAKHEQCFISSSLIAKSRLYHPLNVALIKQDNRTLWQNSRPSEYARGANTIG